MASEQVGIVKTLGCVVGESTESSLHRNNENV
jgi:hypothetical protein